MKKAAKRAYRDALLTLLGVTRLISRAEFSPPSKWLAVIENIRLSSNIAHAKLYKVDEEVGEEFFKKEEIVEKKFGNEKFYSADEVEELKANRDNIRVQIPRF